MDNQILLKLSLHYLPVAEYVIKSIVVSGHGFYVVQTDDVQFGASSLFHVLEQGQESYRPASKAARDA